MRNIIIFEDNVHTPSSFCLEVSTGTFEIVFEGNNFKAISKCLSCVKMGYDNIFIYIDLPINNDMAVGLYVNRRKEILAYKNVYLIPIVCIEEALFHSLCNLDALKVKNIASAKEYCSIMKKFFVDLVIWAEACASSVLCRKLFFPSNTLRSVEKLFKHIFSDCVTTCQENKNSAGKGYFFKEDCSCVGCNVRLRLNEKSQALWAAICAVPTGIIQSPVNQGITYASVKQERQQWFDSLADAINIERILLFDN